MEVNIDAVLELIDSRFRSNISFFADTIKINGSYLNQILNKNKKASSPKLCNAIIDYCNNNGLNYKYYIFLP